MDSSLAHGLEAACGGRSPIHFYIYCSNWAVAKYPTEIPGVSYVTASSEFRKDGLAYHVAVICHVAVRC